MCGSQVADLSDVALALEKQHYRIGEIICAHLGDYPFVTVDAQLEYLSRGLHLE